MKTNAELVLPRLEAFDNELPARLPELVPIALGDVASLAAMLGRAD